MHVGDSQVGVLGIKQRRHPGPHSKARQTDRQPEAEGTVRRGPGQASARKGNTHGLLVSFANGSLRREEEREEVRGHRNTVEAFRTLRLPSTARSLPGPSWLAPVTLLAVFLPSCSLWPGWASGQPPPTLLGPLGMRAGSAEGVRGQEGRSHGVCLGYSVAPTAS